ncbi:MULTISPECIES: threonine export protein RhtC [Rahnella]|uniref:threonine export protein RhtC n=1 Tax=Rahnella TaxID=34037 RepID=UPI0006F6B3FC|nr:MULTISPECIES: threonine export protein RhtC [Rahnella]KQN65973.1 threonine transporter [Serratia sp. Leaf51]MBB6117469.1 threonine efflux protein [Rahnella inusitata]MBU9829278.1 threonine export protein RhtC [Rahnella rivi]THD39368.1 threonine export protein RhtC [Enterobacteriaceae bacterium ML5]
MLMLFLMVAMMHMIALASPGPDFFFVSQTAASRSRKEAMMGVIGITLGVAVWAAVALMGLHLILQKMAWLHQIITVGGGLYLCWMGWQLLKSARSKKQAGETEVVETAVALPANGRTFMRGLLTNLSNPKAVIYFGSVFSMFVGDSVTGGERWGLFILIIAETLAWFTLVALVFALPAMRRGYQRLAKWIDGVAGVVFAGFGIALIVNR